MSAQLKCPSCAKLEIERELVAVGSLTICPGCRRVAEPLDELSPPQQIDATVRAHGNGRNALNVTLARLLDLRYAVGCALASGELRDVEAQMLRRALERTEMRVLPATENAKVAA